MDDRLWRIMQGVRLARPIHTRLVGLDRHDVMTSTSRQTRRVKGPFARRRALILAVVCIVHLMLGFFKYDEPRNDAAEYHALARNLLAHHTFALAAGDPARPGPPSARRMPFYPIFLSLLYAATGHPDAESYLVVGPVQAILMVCVVALIIAIGRKLFGDGPALVAGVLAGLYQPYLFYLPSQLLSETLYMVFLLLSLYLMICADVRRVAVLAVAFGVLGLSILTRANGIFLLPVALIWTWKKLEGVPSRFGLMGLSIVCATLPLMPWCIRNAVAFGEFIPLSTNGGWNFYLGHNEEYKLAPNLGAGTDYAIFDRLMAEGFTESQADRELYARGFAYALDHPGETFVNVFRKAAVIFSVTTLQTWNLLCLIAVLAGVRLLQMKRASVRYRLLGVVALVLGLSFWGSKVASVMLTQQRGLAGVGISFGLLGVASFLGLVIAFRGDRGNWLLPGVFASQIAVSLIYIPIVRIRWTVDFVVILYASVGICAVLTWIIPPEITTMSTSRRTRDLPQPNHTHRGKE